MTSGPTFVSLYSGAGGMDLGFVQAGFTPVWANDIDPLAVATHRSLIPGSEAVAGDVRDQELPGRGAAELVIGGPPCQGFSVAGLMDPDDPRSRHVFEFLDVVNRVRPQAFVMENVKALAENRRWVGILDRLRAEATAMGYQTTLHVLNASHYGVPQARERMFLIGTLGRPVTDIPTTTRHERPSVRALLATLPAYGQPGNDDLCTARVTPAKVPVLRKSPYAGMLFNGQGRPLDLDVPAPTLPATMGGNRTPIIDQLHLEHPLAAPCWAVGYHRHLMSGGAPYDVVPPRMRRITVQEAAAIQTFPPGTQWHGSQSARYRQIGNAVPPMLAFHVAQAVRAALRGE